MFKLILSLLFIAFISMSYGQAIQTGKWGYTSMRVGSNICQNSYATNYTMTQQPTGYQLVSSLGQITLINVTVATDGSWVGKAGLYYINGGFSGFTLAKGVVYNQYAFRAVLFPSPSGNFKGSTNYYSFEGCSSTLLKGAEEQEQEVYNY